VAKQTPDKKKSPLKYKIRFTRRDRELVKALFPILLVSYLLLVLFETIFEGSVSAYINLNYLLIAVIVIGIAAVLSLSGKAEMEKAERLSARDILVIVLAGLGGAAIVWWKTREMGWLSYVISVVSGGLIVLLTMLVWREDGEEESEGKNSQGS
jgi:hypothetical protein